MQGEVSSPRLLTKANTSRGHGGCPKKERRGPFLPFGGSWGTRVRRVLRMIAGGSILGANTYLIASDPCDHYDYFPLVPGLLITFRIFAAEARTNIAVVNTLPIPGGRGPEPAKSKA